MAFSFTTNNTIILNCYFENDLNYLEKTVSIFGKNIKLRAEVYNSDVFEVLPRKLGYKIAGYLFYQEFIPISSLNIILNELPVEDVLTLYSSIIGYYDDENVVSDKLRFFFVKID